MDKVSLVKQCQLEIERAFGILYQTYLAPMREVVAYYIHNLILSKMCCMMVSDCLYINRLSQKMEQK